MPCVLVLFFCLSIRPLLAQDGSHALLLAVRVGALDAREITTDPELTPNLRRLATEGALLARLHLPASFSERPTAEEVLSEIWTETLNRLLTESRIQRLTLTRYPRAGAKALSSLRTRFHTPAPVSDAERAFKRQIREILQLEPVGEGSVGSVPSPPAGRSLAEQVDDALASGVRLVIVVDEAAPPSSEAKMRERDSFLAKLKLGDEARVGVNSAVLSVSTEGEAKLAALVVRGPAVRSGWVFTRSFPLSSLGPTLVSLLDAKLVPPAANQQIVRDLFD